MQAWNSVGFFVIALSLAGGIGCSGAGYEAEPGYAAGAENADISADRVAEFGESGAAIPDIAPERSTAVPVHVSVSERSLPEVTDDSFPALEGGASCGPDSDCQSGKCVDGVCS